MIEVISALGVVGGGIAIAFIIQLAKKWKTIPLESSNKVGIRLLVAILGLSVGIFNAVFEGSQTLDLELLQSLGWDTVQTYAVAWLTYKGVIK